MHLHLHHVHLHVCRRTSTRCLSRTTPSTTATRSRPAVTRPTGTAAMWKTAAQRRRPIRPPAHPASARSSSGRPPASASLGQLVDLFWLAGPIPASFCTQARRIPGDHAMPQAWGHLRLVRVVPGAQPAPARHPPRADIRVAAPPSPRRASRRAVPAATPRRAAPAAALRSQRAARCCGTDGPARPEVRGAPVLEEDDRGGRRPARHHPHQGATLTPNPNPNPNPA